MVLDVTSPVASFRHAESAGAVGAYRILDRLSRTDFDSLARRWERVSFEAGTALRSRSRPTEHCYFIESGFVSIICGGPAARSIEVGNAGSGGVVGLPALFGVTTATHAAVALMPTSAFRIDASALKQLARKSDGLHDLLLHYVEIRMEQSMQLAACNLRHHLNQRLARWIHTVYDQVDGLPIKITHDELAQLLGVRRAGITVGLHILEGEHAIRSRRGRIVVQDPLRLEQLSCQCYRTLRDLIEDGFGTLRPVIFPEIPNG